MTLDHGIASTDTNEIYTWGKNEFGELGTGDRTIKYAPTRVDDKQFQGEVVLSVGAGNGFTVVALTDRVFSWGANQRGQLGLGNTNSECEVSPQPINVLNNCAVIQVSCGNTHAVALTALGTVWTWV